MSTDEMCAAAEALTGDVPVYAPGTARIMGDVAENGLTISVCDQHDEPTPGAIYDVNGHCQSCVFVHLHASEFRFAQQLAALINARKPLAALLEEAIAFVEEYPDLGREHVDGEPCDDYACGIVTRLRAVARSINAAPAPAPVGAPATPPVPR